jgi:purine-binding chemotaxis protein CheW
VLLLGGRPFAIDVRAATEIVVFGSPTPVPKGPPHLLGVANLRGAVIPVLDVQPLLGLSARRVTARLPALVVSWAGGQVAIAVDRVLGLESFGEVLPFSEAAAGQYGEYGVGLLPREGTFIPLLDMPRLVEALRREEPAGRSAARAAAAR